MDFQIKHDIAVLRGELNQIKASLGARDIDEVAKITRQIVTAIKTYETQIAAMQKEIITLQQQVKALTP